MHALRIAGLRVAKVKFYKIGGLTRFIEHLDGDSDEEFNCPNRNNHAFEL